MRLENARSPLNPASVALLAISLLAIGVVMVASASGSIDRPLLGPGMWSTPFGRQLIFVAIGVGLMLSTAYLARNLLDYDFVPSKLPWLLLLAVIGFLVVALIPGIGNERHGSQRWLRFAAGGVQIGFQPSEVAKLALVVALATILAGTRASPTSFVRGFLPALVVTGVIVALVGKENFGTAALLAAVAASMMLVAGCKFLHLFMMTCLGASGMCLLLLAARYRLDRLTTHQDLWADPTGSGYQPIQSLVTIASGGWLGTGLGDGLQKYGYLPESHSDFVFAMICEELGFFGGALTILLFCGLGYLGLRIMRFAANDFERMLAFGLTVLILLQAIINISVVTVVAPTTGVPLPFVSAGGSGVFVMSTLVGLLVAIAARGSTAPQRVTE